MTGKSTYIFICKETLKDISKIRLAWYLHSKKRAKKNELIVITLLLPQQRITLYGSVFMVTFDDAVEGAE